MDGPLRVQWAGSWGRGRHDVVLRCCSLQSCRQSWCQGRTRKKIGTTSDIGVFSRPLPREKIEKFKRSKIENRKFCPSPSRALARQRPRSEERKKQQPKDTTAAEWNEHLIANIRHRSKKPFSSSGASFRVNAAILRATV